MMERVRASLTGRRCKCPSRCSTTCRSVSATKPRLARSPAKPASAPIAKEPAYHTGSRRLRRPASEHCVATMSRFVLAHLLNDGACAGVVDGQAVQVSFEVLDHLPLGLRYEA